MFPLLNFPAILAILPPCCSAVGTSKELGRGLVAASCLDEPVERLVVVALWALSLRLRKGPYFLFFSSYYDDLFFFMCQPPNLLVAETACVTAFSVVRVEFI